MAKRLITRDEILNKQEEKNPLTPLMEANLAKLLDAVNKFRLLYGKPMIVSSGYRPPEHNKRVGGAPNSSHLTCEAVDFRDKDGAIKAWVQANLGVLEQCGLYAEAFEATPTWIHLQIRRPTSGSRIFKP